LLEEIRTPKRRDCSRGALAATLLGGFTALAQSSDALTPRRPRQGTRRPKRFCKGCHRIDSSPDSTTAAGVSDLLRHRQSSSAEHIMGVFIMPHAPMPDVHLTDEEIRNLLAYFEPLRTDATIPPLALPPLHAPERKLSARA
jgi:hypothetical protein